MKNDVNWCEKDGLPRRRLHALFKGTGGGGPGSKNKFSLVSPFFHLLVMPDLMLFTELKNFERVPRSDPAKLARFWRFWAKISKKRSKIGKKNICAQHFSATIDLTTPILNME